MFKEIANTARRIIGWRTHSVLVAINEPNPEWQIGSPDLYLRAAMHIDVLARDQQHARERVATHIRRTLPDGWFAYVDGRYIRGPRSRALYGKESLA